MCRKYDTRFTNKCDDDRTDPPLRKDTANFCDYFSPSSESFEAEERAASQAAATDLKALFGEGDPAAINEEDEAHTELDALFNSNKDES